MSLRTLVLAAGATTLSVTGVLPASAEDVPFTVIKLPTAKPIAPKRGKNRAPKIEYFAAVIQGPHGFEPRQDVPLTDPYATVGRGYDPVTQQVLDKPCVVEPGGNKDAPLEGTIKHQHKGVFSDENGYASASGSSIGVSAVIKAIKLGFGTSSSSASSFTSINQYGRVYYSVATDGSERRLVQWTPRAKSLLQNRQIQTFLKECGVSYLRAVYKGHLLDTTARFELREDQHAASSATSLSIGVKDIFEVAGSSADAQSSVSQIARVNFDVNSLGRFASPQPKKAAPPSAALRALGTDQPPTTPPGSDKPAEGDKPPQPSSGTSSQAGASTSSPSGPSKIDDLLTWYETGFEDAVQADLDAAPPPGQPKKNSALPLYATLELYRVKDDLEYTDRIPVWPEAIYKAISDKATLYNRLVSAIAEMKSVTDVPLSTRLTDFYVGETEATVGTKRTAADALLEAFQTAVGDCGDYILAAKPKTSTSEDVVVACTTKLGVLTEAKIKAVELNRKYENPPAKPQHQ